MREVCLFVLFIFVNAIPVCAESLQEINEPSIWQELREEETAAAQKTSLEASEPHQLTNPNPESASRGLPSTQPPVFDFVAEVVSFEESISSVALDTASLDLKPWRAYVDALPQNQQQEWVPQRGDTLSKRYGEGAYDLSLWEFVGYVIGTNPDLVNPDLIHAGVVYIIPSEKQAEVEVATTRTTQLANQSDVVTHDSEQVTQLKRQIQTLQVELANTQTALETEKKQTQKLQQALEAVTHVANDVQKQKIPSLWWLSLPLVLILALACWGYRERKTRIEFKIHLAEIQETLGEVDKNYKHADAEVTVIRTALKTGGFETVTLNLGTENWAEILVIPKPEDKITIYNGCGKEINRATIKEHLEECATCRSAAGYLEAAA